MQLTVFYWSFKKFNFERWFLILIQGTHGFMKTHEWRKTIGAFINVEASGTGGLGMMLLLANIIINCIT